MAQKATLIDPQGKKVVVESGSPAATSYFSQGYKLMGADGKPVSQTPVAPLSPTLPAGMTQLTSPAQIPQHDIKGQVGATGTPGSFLYGMPSAPSTPSGGAASVASTPAPGQGSASAFNSLFGKIMENARNSQYYMDQKAKILKHVFDEPLSPQDMQGLPQSVQDVLTSKNPALAGFSVQLLNDQLRGRVDENMNALSYLFTGQKEDAARLQQEQAKSQTQKDKSIASFQGMLDKNPQLWAALSDEGRTAIMNGEMPSQEDIASVGTEYSRYVKQYTGGGGSGAAGADGVAMGGNIPTPTAPAAPVQPTQTFEQFVAEKEKEKGMSLSPKAREALRSEYEVATKAQMPERGRLEADISKFHPKVQGLITGLYDLGADFTDTEKTKFAGQINQAATEGLLKDQVSVGGKMKNDAYWKAAERLSANYKKETGGYITMRDAYQKGVAISPDTKNPYDHVTLIFAYMKVNDPTSVVREGEYATAQNAAGVPARIRNMYNSSLTGQKLTKSQIIDIKKTMKGQYNQQLGNYEKVRDVFNNRASKQRIDAEDAIIDYSETVGRADNLSPSSKESNYIKNLKLSSSGR